MMTFETLMMLVVGGLFMVAIRYASKNTARLQLKAVHETARHFDLTLQPTGASSKTRFCAHGEVNGVGVDVAIELRFNGEVDKEYLVCRAFVASADLADLELVPRSPSTPRSPAERSSRHVVHLPYSLPVDVSTRQSNLLYKAPPDT